MPRYKKPGTGRDFKKGWKGGPGRPPIPKELREARKLNAIEIEERINKIGRMKADEIKEYVSSGMADHFDRLIIGQFGAGIKGTTASASFLFDRSAGPMKQKIQIDSSIGGEISAMSEEEKLRLLEEINATKNIDKPGQ